MSSSRSQLVDQLSGRGSLERGATRIDVSYVIDVWGGAGGDAPPPGGTADLSIYLSNHSDDPFPLAGKVVTLVLVDGRRIAGLLTAQGTRLIQAGEVVE